MEELLACRVCLATSVKLHNMRSNHLVNAYESLTGIKMVKQSYPEHICSYCASLLLKSVSFKDKCNRAMELLNTIVLKSGMLTSKDITSIDRRGNNLLLPYTCQNVEVNIKEEIERKSPALDIGNNMDSCNEDSRDASVDTSPLVRPASPIDIPMSPLSPIHINEIKGNFSSEDEPLSIKVKRKKKESIKLEEFQSVNIELVTLTKEEQIEEVLARKKSVNYQNSMYKCDKCFKGFIMDVTYKNHMFRHDPLAGAHACDVCHTRWESARALRSHSLAAHARKYVCRVCTHVTRSRHRAREHAYWHNGHMFRCSSCGATFSKSTSYLTHLRLRHATSHRCEICSEAFLSANGLNIHRKKAHRQGSCQALPPEESQHRTTGPLQCALCNRTFAHKRSVAVHHQRVHLGVKISPSKESRRRVVVVCEICGSECISKASLVHHQRIHSGEKPFQCPQCPKNFSVCQRLQIHLRTHSGERPFKCPLCPKAFKHKAALNRHHRVHTGVKPYACSHCGKAFSQSNSMKLHVRTVHLKLPAPYRSRTKIRDEALA